MTVQAPADKRFRRAHVSPVRRRRLWPPNWIFLAVLVAVLLGSVALGHRAVLWAMRSESLTVQHITVEGNVRMSTGEVTALLDGLRGQPMLTTDLEAWKPALKASPWVADVAFRRVFPGRIAVAIVEKNPIALGRFRSALYLLDRSAAIIDEYGPSYAALDLPIVTGLDAGTAETGPRVDEARAALAVRVLESLAPRRDLIGRVSDIDVTDTHNAVLTLKDDPTLVRLGDAQFAYRLQTYLDLSPTLHERVPDADYVDVRFDNRVYVRPAAAAETAGLTPAAHRTVPAGPPGGGRR